MSECGYIWGGCSVGRGEEGLGKLLKFFFLTFTFVYFIELYIYFVYFNIKKLSLVLHAVLTGLA